jgi:hypothetical protein
METLTIFLSVFGWLMLMFTTLGVSVKVFMKADDLRGQGHPFLAGFLGSIVASFWIATLAALITY